MLFNSFEYLIYLPLVFAIYWLLNKHLKVQNSFLFIASYFFYGWWDYRFLGLLILSTLIDYVFGFLVDSPKPFRRKLFMWLSIVNNLGLLAIFKYYNFFIHETQYFFGTLGIHISPHVLNLALPIGISFYTFHGMSYVLDIYRGNFRPVKSFIDYALFVSFFPLLVAGPIERAWHLLPQIQSRRQFDYKQAKDGMGLILYGLFKKIVVSDSISGTVDAIFNGYGQQTSLNLVLGAILFAFQIYADFSGYSDIATGTAKLLGFELLSNFRFPYFSRNIAEFWRRWHISLSSWFRDYLYIPLGGSKGSKTRSIRNVLIIFLVSGFWHGANWTFIAWGLIHGLMFLPIFLFNSDRKKLDEVVAYNRLFPNVREMMQMVITFTAVTMAWIFFRSPNINDALGYIKRIFTQPLSLSGVNFFALQGLLYGFVLLLLDWVNRYNERELAIFAFNRRWVRFTFYIALAMFVFTSISLTSEQKTFIYFQF